MPLPRPAQLRLLVNIAAYLALALLPLTAMVTGWRGRRRVPRRAVVPRPKISVGAVRQDRFQARADAWFQRYLGLAGTSISVDNAILYHLFGETKHGSPVRMGEDGVMFIDDDLNHYNKYGIAVTGPPYLDELARRLAALQRELARQGKAIVPVIVPSKTSIYRDKISSEWAAELGQLRPTDVATYYALTLALAAHGVRYVDARKLLTERPEERRILWGPQARHWSHYGACLVLGEVASAYAELTGKPRPAHECQLEMRPVRRHSSIDLDLLRLVNALFARPTYPEVPGTHHAPPAPAPRPSVLMVGTSFCWQLGEELKASGAWGPIHLNYYNSIFYTLADLSEERVKVNSPAWRAGTLDKDLYLVELFESYLTGGSYVDQFLDQAGPQLVAGEKP